MVSAIQEVALRMCFARRFFLLFLLMATFATTGQALSMDWDGNVRAAAIKSFTFTYGGGTVADSTYQHVGIHNITFTRVPEINPAWTAAGSCIVAAALKLRHSAKFRK